jgi:hypothetical protein
LGLIIVIKEETKLGTEYSALKDDNGKPIKFKTVADAEEKLRSVFEVNPTASFVLLNG